MSIFNFAASALSSWMNADSVRDTNSSNREMVRVQNAENLKQWKRENAYNHPVNQVQRLKAAGLNPGLLYGQPPVNTAAPSPTMQSSRDMPTNYNFVGSNPLEDMRTIAEIKNIEADTESKEHATTRDDETQVKTLQKLSSEIDEINKRVAGMDIQQQRDSLAYIHESLRYQFDSANFNNALMSAHESLRKLRSDIRLTDQAFKRSVELLPLELAGYDLSNRKLRSAIALDWQTYRQTEDLFDTIKNIKESELDNLRSDNTLKELQFWIDAIDNPNALKSYNTRGGYILGDDFGAKSRLSFLSVMDGLGEIPIFKFFKK